jgi:hypothetical protein
MFFKKNLKKVSNFFSDSCNQILSQKKPGFKDEKASYIGSNNTYCQIGIMIKNNKDALNRKIIKQNVSFSNMPIKSKKSFCKLLVGFYCDDLDSFMQELQNIHDSSVLVYTQEGYDNWLNYYNNNMQEFAKKWDLNAKS